MALLGFIKPNEDPSREPELRDRSTLLAYVEELIRLGTSVEFRFQGQDLATHGRLVDLFEDGGYVEATLSRAVSGDIKGPRPVELVFPIDGMRFVAPLKFLDRAGYLRGRFSLPELVRHAERRTKMRARFGAREKASVTLLEGLFEGVGASGRLVNLSMHGAGVLLERAISIGQDRQVRIGTGLFAPNTPLAVVRIQHLPHTPLIECSGRVVHMAEGGLGVQAGIHLLGLDPHAADWIAQVLGRRLPTFGRGFPVKRRRADLELRPEPEPEEEPEAEAEGAARPEAPEPVAPLADQAKLSPAERLQAIRRLGKRMLVVSSDDLERAILAGTLRADGFHKILEAGAFSEALEACRRGPLDLIFLEETIGAHKAQDFLERLRRQGGCAEVPVVLLADHVDVRVNLMAKAARIAHVQSRPVNYDGALKGVIEGLLNL